MSDFARLLRLFRPAALWMLGGCGLGTLVILANVGLLALSGWFIAAMALAGLGRIPVEVFAPAAAIRALAILRTGGRYGERLVTHEATFRVLSRLRVFVYARLEPLAPAGLQTYRGGDLLSRLRADVDSLDTFYLRVLAPAIAVGLATAVMLAVLAAYDPAMALLDGVALALAGVALPMLAQRLGREPGRRLLEGRAELRAATADAMRGLGELMVYGADERQAEVLEAASLRAIGERRRQARLDGATTALSGLIAHGATAGALVLAIPLVASRALPAADLAMLALFVLAGFEAVAPLPAAFQSLGETRAAARRIFALVDAAPALRDPPDEPVLPRCFDLRIEGLRMRYADDAPWAIDGLDLTVPAGSSVAIVGASGAGKTSLANVLLRFWDFQEGKVEIGGVPLRALRGETMRGFCSVVAQATHLFNASVRDNLRLARPDADDAVLDDALAKAGLLEEVRAMPHGLDTMVGELGTRLSGGQARRLSIARAMLKAAPILILDEPTEGLDTVSEERVMQALLALMQGRTTLLITHRTSILRHVDTVVAIKHADGGSSR